MGVSNGGGGSDPDLLLAANGGTEFADRVSQLIAVRSEASQALEQLNLGKQARAAFEETHAQLMMAKGAVASANEQAGHAISEAKQQAAAIVANAERVVDQLKTDASNMRQEALTLKNAAKADADKAFELRAEVETEKANLEKLSLAARQERARLDDKLQRVLAAMNAD